MGCGASARPPPKETVDETIVEPVDITWATKTGDAEKGIAQGALFTSSAKGIQGSPVILAKHDHNVKVLDADEDDYDEIEIIYEKPSKHQQVTRHLGAANGQDPDEAAEMDMRPKEEPKPLSKQQQEEAAKLAERRKVFDNQRYQREQQADVPTVLVKVPGVLDSQGYPDRADRTPSKPTTDMMLGLNVTEFASKEPALPQCYGLPGGILDDEPEYYQPTPQKKNRHQQHDDVKSTGFDDDDEKLMKEILENFDDL